MERPEDTGPNHPGKVPHWPGLSADLLTGVCLTQSRGDAALAPADAAARSAVERVQDLAASVGLRDITMAPAVVALVRAGASLPAADAEKIDAYRWNLGADGDEGHAAAYRRERCPVLNLTPTVFVDACQAVAGRVAEEAAAAVRLWPFAGHAGGGQQPRDALDAALLAVIQRDPGPGERALALALAAEGGTQGRVWRRLQRHGLETATKRLRWVLAEGAMRMAEAAGAPGLEAMYRYHLAAAWVRQREGLPVSQVLPEASEAAAV